MLMNGPPTVKSSEAILLAKVVGICQDVQLKSLLSKE